MKKNKITIFLFLVLVIVFGLYIYNKKKNNVSFLISDNNLSVIYDEETIQTISLSTEAIEVIQTEVNSSNKQQLAFIIDQDVNFDGHNDVAVLTGIGYGGVNMFYDYYIFNSTTNKLEKSTTLIQVSNPKVNTLNKEVVSSYRSGPQWYSQTFQFDGLGYIKSTETKKNIFI